MGKYTRLPGGMMRCAGTHTSAYREKLESIRALPPLKTRAMADECAWLLTRITGDLIEVRGNDGQFLLDRWTGTEWVRG